MRILFICSAKVWGGNEKWVSKAMDGLRDRHDIIFLGKAPHLQKRFGNNSRSYWAPFNSVFDWKTKRIISRVVKENGIDVIVSTKKKEYFLAGLVARKMRIKHVLRLGIVRKMRVPLWSKFIYRTLNNGIIVNAYKIKNELHKHAWMKGHPIKVVYNGLDITEPRERANPNNKSDFMIVSTGMLTRRKGFHVLIEAVANLPDRYQRRLQLHILGKGREEENLKKQIQKKGLKGVVHLEGFCNPLPWLQRADLFCLLSRNEGVSNALLEAMANSVPVLTTEAGGSGEFIKQGENGFLVSAQVNEVAGKIEEIMDMSAEQMLQAGNNGKQTVQSLFNHERMVKEVEIFLHNFT